MGRQDVDCVYVDIVSPNLKGTPVTEMGSVFLQNDIVNVQESVFKGVWPTEVGWLPVGGRVPPIYYIPKFTEVDILYRVR